METVYEILYRRPQRARFCQGCSCNLQAGDRVVMAGEREVGRVIWKGMAAEVGPGVDLAQVQKASVQDKDRALDLRQKERAALDVFKEKIEAHGLPMKPVDVCVEADGTRITFYFTADRRVDFRQLVRDLARIYRRRIELLQISPRIESQMLGGCGPCGRELCCASFIRTPRQVPARMAQEQAYSQSLSKLVGVCGQLKCCLRYEFEEGSGCAGCAKKTPEDVLQVANTEEA